MNLKIGDYLMVLRPDYPEEAGRVHEVEPGGRVFINYGGVVRLLGDEDQVREIPLDILEAIKLNLELNEKDRREQVEDLFGWISKRFKI